MPSTLKIETLIYLSMANLNVQILFCKVIHTGKGFYGNKKATFHYGSFVSHLVSIQFYCSFN